MLGLRVVMALRTSRVVLGAGGALKALGVASGDAALGPPSPRLWVSAFPGAAMLPCPSSLRTGSGAKGSCFIQGKEN